MENIKDEFLTAMAGIGLIALFLTKSKRSIYTNKFSLWSTCSNQPYYIQDFIYVPVGDTSPCYIGAVSDKYKLTQFSFDGIWNGTSIAPSSTEEMAIFATSDTQTWKGLEFGFVETNNDNTLKGYVQDGINNYYNYVVLGTTDGIQHKYKASVTKSENIYTFNWYIDNILINTLTYTNSSNDYTAQYYSITGTTHKLSVWNSSSLPVFIKFGNIIYS